MLPTNDSLLSPQVTNNRSGLIKNQERQSKYYNRNAKDMDTLKTGDTVRVQPSGSNSLWSKATVCTPLGDRSHVVELDSGGVLRRNRRHLRKASGLRPELPTQHKLETRLNPVSQSTVSPSTTTRSGRLVQRPAEKQH